MTVSVDQLQSEAAGACEAWVHARLVHAGVPTDVVETRAAALAEGAIEDLSAAIDAEIGEACA